MTGISIVITPLRNKFGSSYGAEARDQNSNALLATAKQVDFDEKTQILVVEETQYSPGGDVIYMAKLFFGPGGDLQKEQPIEGQKRWNIFQSWSL